MYTRLIYRCIYKDVLHLKKVEIQQFNIYLLLLIINKIVDSYQ